MRVSKSLIKRVAKLEAARAQRHNALRPLADFTNEYTNLSIEEWSEVAQLQQAQLMLECRDSNNKFPYKTTICLL